MYGTTTLKQLILGDLEQEFALTRRMLERVPEAHCNWKPHTKSMTLGQLARHIINLPLWIELMLEQEEFDMASADRQDKDVQSCHEMLELFDQRCAKIQIALNNLDEESLQRPWSLYNEDMHIYTRPRNEVIRQIGLSHLIHHRGQLSVYLRLLDVSVPATYGPSADEDMDVI